MRKLVLLGLLVATNLQASECLDLTGEYLCRDLNGIEYEVVYSKTGTKITKERKSTEHIYEVVVNGELRENKSFIGGYKVTLDFNGKTVREHFYGEPQFVTYKCDKDSYQSIVDDGSGTDFIKVISMKNGNIIVKEYDRESEIDQNKNESRKLNFRYELEVCSPLKDQE